MSTSSHVPQSRLYTCRQKSVASLLCRVVPTRRRCSSRCTLLFAELNLSPELFYDAEAKRAQADLAVRLARTDSPRRKCTSRDCSIDWQGQLVYARRDEYLYGSPLPMAVTRRRCSTGWP